MNIKELFRYIDEKGFFWRCVFCGGFLLFAHIGYYVLWYMYNLFLFYFQMIFHFDLYQQYKELFDIAWRGNGFFIALPLGLLYIYSEIDYNSLPQIEKSDRRGSTQNIFF